MNKTKLLFVILFCLFSTLAFPADVIKNIFWGHGLLVLDHQGNMYIGYDSYSITKYSPDGKSLLRIGRKGEGPGDIKRIGRYTFNPKDNTLYVTEFYNGNRWVSRFTPDGKFAGHWNFEFNWSKYDIVSAIDFDKEGNVILAAEKRAPRRYKDFVITHKTYDLLKFSPEGKFLNRIYTFNTDSDAEKRGNFQATIPFQNAVNWRVCKDKIIVKEISSDIINIFSADGKLEKKIPFPVKKEKVTKKDIDTWENELNESPSIKKYKAMGVGNVRYWRENLPFPEYKPNSSIMYMDSKENLYVREYTQYQDKKTPLWYKVNLQTGKTDTLTFNPGEELCGIWGGYVFIYKAIEEDDEEIETITRIKEEELFKKEIQSAAK